MVKIDKKWCYFHLKWCYLHLRWCYLHLRWCYFHLRWCYFHLRWCYLHLKSEILNLKSTSSSKVGLLLAGGWSSSSKVGLPPRRMLVFPWSILVDLQGLRHLEHLRHLPPPPSWPCGMSMEVFLLFWSILVDLQGLRHLGGSSGPAGDRLGWIKFNPALVGTEAHHLT